MLSGSDSGLVLGVGHDGEMGEGDKRPEEQAALVEGGAIKLSARRGSEARFSVCLSFRRRRRTLRRASFFEEAVRSCPSIAMSSSKSSAVSHQILPILPFVACVKRGSRSVSGA